MATAALGERLVVRPAPVPPRANIAAEIGTMRVTEQIDALETLAYDPFAYLVVPRVIAGAVMFPVVVGWRCAAAPKAWGAARRARWYGAR